MSTVLLDQKTLGLTRWKTGGIRKYPFIHSTLIWSNTPLLTPCSTSLAKLANYSYLALWPFTWFNVLNVFLFRHKNPYTETYNTSAMFESHHLYCAHAKLHAPFPFDGPLLSARACWTMLWLHVCTREELHHYPCIGCVSSATVASFPGRPTSSIWSLIVCKYGGERPGRFVTCVDVR